MKEQASACKTGEIRRMGCMSLWQARPPKNASRFVTENMCSGYSWRIYINCLLWLPTVAGGGAEWGGCSCRIKKDKDYVNLGPGKCLDNGKDPKYQFLTGKTEAECNKQCDDSKTCGGLLAKHL